MLIQPELGSAQPRGTHCLWKALLSLHSCVTSLPPMRPQTACHLTFSPCLWACTESTYFPPLNRALQMPTIVTTTLIAPHSLEKISMSWSHATATLWTLGSNSPNPSLLYYSHSIFSLIMTLVPHKNAVQHAHKGPSSPFNSSGQQKGWDLLKIPQHSWVPEFPIFLRRTLGCCVSVAVGPSFSHLAGVLVLPSRAHPTLPAP